MASVVIAVVAVKVAEALVLVAQAAVVLVAHLRVAAVLADSADKSGLSFDNFINIMIMFDTQSVSNICCRCHYCFFIYYYFFS